jgi:ATP-dependent Clp protease ATP-binding subunit ClpX
MNSEADEMDKRLRLACSFCGKSAAEVAKLVAGPKVYICDECVATANRIMQGAGPDQEVTQQDRSSFLSRLHERFRRAFNAWHARRSMYPT